MGPTTTRLGVAMNRVTGSDYFDIFLYFVGPHGRRSVVAGSIVVERIDNDVTGAVLLMAKVDSLEQISGCFDK
jgi:hypothetical protein